MIQSDSPTSDERVLAALSHLFGIFVALVVWATQKDKSRFVRFQSLQALAFEALAIAVSMVMMMGLFLVFFLGMILFLAVGINALPPQGDPSGMSGILFMLPILLSTLIFPLMMIPILGLTIVRIIAAVRVYRGQDFRYPWLGRRVEIFLKR
jgi:uncharacterized Tic20 family protein